MSSAPLEATCYSLAIPTRIAPGRSEKFNATVYISTPGWWAEKLGSGSPVRAKLTDSELRDLSPMRVPPVDGKRTSSGRLADITRLYYDTPEGERRLSPLGYS